MNEKWEKANLSAKTKGEALDEGFHAALSKEAAPIIGPPPARPITRTLAEIIQSNQTIEIELNQTLLVKTGSPIVKFIATDEGIVSMETVNADILGIVGKGVGSTFLHLWNADGRKTFEIRVVGPKFIPSKYYLDQIERFEKSRPFKIEYANSRSASYTGDKFRDMSRNGVDFSQNFSLEGDTPYGALSSHAQTQKFRGKTLLSEAQVALKDGKIGP